MSDLSDECEQFLRKLQLSRMCRDILLALTKQQREIVCREFNPRNPTATPEMVSELFEKYTARYLDQAHKTFCTHYGLSDDSYHFMKNLGTARMCIVMSGFNPRNKGADVNAILRSFATSVQQRTGHLALDSHSLADKGKYKGAGDKGKHKGGEGKYGKGGEVGKYGGGKAGGKNHPGFPLSKGETAVDPGWSR